ncbi:hypothetical protein ACEPPN_017128 [Leptodophora sp. 'Broadleaf-Isolate-01']
MDNSNETIRRGLAALDMISADHPDRIKLLNSIGLLLYLKYTETKAMIDLQQAIRVAQEVLEATPEGHPNKEIWSNNLGNLLSDKYSSTEEMADLNDAIRVARQTVHMTPKEHKNQPMWLNNFGVLLNKRYLRTGIESDHEEALHVSREAVRITHKDHPELGGRLNNLRVQLGHRYSKTREMPDLEEAIRVAQECVRATPEHHPDRGGRLESLGILLDSKHSTTGATADIEECIRVTQESINMTPRDHPYRGSRLNLLGVQLTKRYLKMGEMADIDNAIRITQEAISAVPGQGGQPEGAGWLNNLAICLGQRYAKIGALGDLEQAIQASRGAVNNTPKANSNLASCLCNLGYLLTDRYSRVRQLTDLDEAIMLIRNAIGLTPEDNTSQKAALKNNLGLALGQRFLETETETDIDEAVRAVQEAVDLTSRDNPNWPKRLQNLATIFGKRYANTESIADLEASIRMAQEAVDATPENIPNRAIYLNSLGKALFARFLKTNTQDDLERVISCSKSALYQPNSLITSRIEAGKSLLACYGFTSDWQLAYDTAKVVLGLIPQLTPRSLRNSDKQHLLSQISGLASDAAAAALEIGKSPLVALEFLEQGRGVLAGSLDELQVDALDLQKKHGELAERFTRLRDELEPPIIQNISLTEEDPQPWQAQATRRYDAADEFDRLIAEIRQQPGFADFLLAPSSEDMQAAATYGPIVIINVSGYRCDAVIVERHQIRSLALQNLDSNEIEEIARKGDLGHPDILEWLWHTIANPVLDALGFRELPSTWPHMWWIPTGLLTKFPLHAAGLFNKSGIDNTLDRVISSYNLSVKAIIRGRQSRIPASIPSASPQALLIAMRDTPGCISQLPFAAKEVSMLHGICKSMAIDTIEPRRYKKDILALLPSCKIFHFAGHANANRVDPSRSQLLLEDWETDPLMVGTLMEMKLRERLPFLAYLSACGTGQIKDDRFVDESIHLVSAYQLAGFRHVVGTLWEVNDETCVDIARMTYEGMRDKGMTDEAVCWGLHTAIREVRNKWVSEMAHSREASQLTISGSNDGDLGGATLPRDIEASDQDDEKPLYWVPYVHFGV